jgi:hypothetical protein
MTTWREQEGRWRAWARDGGAIDPAEADSVSAFYAALANHSGKGGSLDDEMPADLFKQLSRVE